MRRCLPNQSRGRHLRASPRLLLAAALLAVWSCRGSSDRVEIVVTLDAQARDTQIAEITAFAGGDKHVLPPIAPGGRSSVTLKPGVPRSNVTLLYRMAGEGHIWEGPELPGGYRISILVDGKGAVAERHCLLPCKLE